MKQKNLLFIFADQWRRSAVGQANDDPVVTPNFDAFAQEGVYCTNAISSCPLCSPHRASLLTGKHPLSTGVFTNCKTGLSMKLGDDEITLGDILKEKGYATGYIGKWHLDEPEENRCKNPVSGARNWDAYTPKGAGRHGFDDWYSYGAFDRHLHPHYWEHDEKMIQIDQWSPIHETNRAIEFIGKEREEPFALVISYNPPHSPYDQVPAKYHDIYKDKDIPLRGNVMTEKMGAHTGEYVSYTQEEMVQVTKQYYAAVSGIDDQFGRIMAVLKATGQLENTCVVVSADHGDMMGSHGMMGKHVWFEESIGIPFIAGGGGLDTGVCDSVFGSADVLPTLLDWMDVPIPDSVEGTSVYPQLQSSSGADDSTTYICACPGRNIFLEAFAAAGKNPMHFGWRAIRTQSYTYVMEVGYQPEPNKQRILYDLKNDPLQMNPLSLTDHKQLVERLEKELMTFLNQQGDQFTQHFTE